MTDDSAGPIDPIETEPAQGSAPDRARRRAQAIKYVGALDGIRALAALGVVIIHSESEANASMATYAITGAFTGPFFSAFFLITGFVLYRGWARRHLALRDPRPAPGTKAAGSADGGSDGRSIQFLLRRLIRIYPLYWVVAAAAVFVSRDTHSYSAGELIQVFLLSPFPDVNVLVNVGLGIVVWTLIIDILFYVYVTIHGYVMTWVIRRLRAFTPFQIEITVLLVMIFGPLIAAPFVRFPIAIIAALPVGMLYALTEAQQDRTGRRLIVVENVIRASKFWIVLIAVVAPVTVWSVVDASNYDEFIADTWPVHVLLLTASALLVATVLWGPRRWPFNRFLASRFLQRSGVITYGMYLWHPVVLLVLNREWPDGGLAVYLPITLVCSVGLAFVTYVTIEQPLSRLRTTLRAAPAPASTERR